MGWFGFNQQRDSFAHILTKDCLSLFHHFIEMRTAVSYGNVFLLENLKKKHVFLHEMDKLMAVLMSRMME